MKKMSNTEKKIRKYIREKIKTLLIEAKKEDPKMKEKHDMTYAENEEKKDPEISPDKWKGECMGVDLEVKGASYADVNHLRLVGQIRKLLEGRGTYVKKVTIEMEEPKEVKIMNEIVDKLIEEILGGK